jgi:hypothetical protein
MLLSVRQGTSQQWTDPLAGSRELGNSHELSMQHPTRLSLSLGGQAAPGNRLWNGTHHRCVYASGAGSDCPAVVLRACWLRSPPHTRASPVTGGAEPDRCQGRGWNCGPVSSRRIIEQHPQGDSLHPWLRNRGYAYPALVALCPGRCWASMKRLICGGLCPQHITASFIPTSLNCWSSPPVGSLVRTQLNSPL